MCIFCKFLFGLFDEETLPNGLLNPIALRKAKIVYNFAFLSAIGLKEKEFAPRGASYYLYQMTSTEKGGHNVIVSPESVLP